MSQEILVRGFFCGIYSLAFAWVVCSRNQEEADRKTTGQRYMPYIPGYLLPLHFLIVTALGMILHGTMGAVRFILSMCFGVFLHISVYYLILTPVMGVFRRKISARACAMLWMIPNYLYIAVLEFMKLPRPRMVIAVPGNTIWTLFFIWFLGFLTVIGWKMTEHFMFRRRVLLDAVPVTDPQVLSIWEKAMQEARMEKPSCKLVASPAVKTPLSVGLFPASTKVILPMQSYSREDLRLIFRHEVIHIARQDAWSKFSLMFCTAMCWFNPLMWVAMKKSGEDLELSCDETVLLDADDSTRKRYALLLLDHAGDGRGFTTCLSASARSMRYRLKNIVKPALRRSGALAVGAVFFILSMTCGYVALAYGGRSGGEVLSLSGDFSQYSIRSVSLAERTSAADYQVTNEKDFHEYLSGLTFCELTGNYSFSESNRELTCLLDTPEGTEFLRLHDQIMEVVSSGTVSYYYIMDGVDWDYLYTILAAHPALSRI